jgi:hypothetical protein
LCSVHIILLVFCTYYPVLRALKNARIHECLSKEAFFSATVDIILWRFISIKLAGF